MEFNRVESIKKTKPRSSKPGFGGWFKQLFTTPLYFYRSGKSAFDTERKTVFKLTSGCFKRKRDKLSFLIKLPLGLCFLFNSLRTQPRLKILFWKCWTIYSACIQIYVYKFVRVPSTDFLDNYQNRHLLPIVIIVWPRKIPRFLWKTQLSKPIALIRK